MAIIILEGEVETLGERVKPCSVIFHPAGESHGMRNPGGSPARYVVFEFHGDGARATETPVVPETVRARKLIDPRRWKSTIKQLLKVSV